MIFLSFRFPSTTNKRAMFIFNVSMFYPCSRMINNRPVLHEEEERPLVIKVPSEFRTCVFFVIYRYQKPHGNPFFMMKTKSFFLRIMMFVLITLSAIPSQWYETFKQRRHSRYVFFCYQHSPHLLPLLET